MAYVIPILCFAVPLLVGVFACRRGMVWVIPLLCAVFLALMGWALWQGRQAEGWDGLGYAIVALLMAAPALVGVLAGGALGWWLGRRQQ